jgi:hypothetical protein
MIQMEKKKRNIYINVYRRVFSLLSQLPTSRAPSTLLSQHQEDYLLAARNSGFNPYALATSGPLDHSSLHPSMYSHPFASYRSVLTHRLSSRSVSKFLFAFVS